MSHGVTHKARPGAAKRHKLIYQITRSSQMSHTRNTTAYKQSHCLWLFLKTSGLPKTKPKSLCSNPDNSLQRPPNFLHLWKVRKLNNNFLIFWMFFCALCCKSPMCHALAGSGVNVWVRQDCVKPANESRCKYSNDPKFSYSNQGPY